MLLVVGAFAILGFLLQFHSRESVYCIRDSLDFRFGITERVIRHFPTPHADRDRFITSAAVTGQSLLNRK